VEQSRAACIRAAREQRKRMPVLLDSLLSPLLSRPGQRLWDGATLEADPSLQLVYSGNTVVEVCFTNLCVS
jgi:hypothetical protein